MQTRRVRAVIMGRVQGVGYRASAQEEAGRLGLTGWVRNRKDGSVELEAEGPADAVETLLAWCAKGPWGARVDGVESEEQAPSGAAGGFEITR
jgi:acylphosphatase